MWPNNWSKENSAETKQKSAGDASIKLQIQEDPAQNPDIISSLQ